MWSACDRDFIGDIALRLTSITRNARWYHETRLVISPVIGDRWYSTRASKILAVICVQQHVR